MIPFDAFIVFSPSCTEVLEASLDMANSKAEPRWSEDVIAVERRSFRSGDKLDVKLYRLSEKTSLQAFGLR